MDRKYIRFLRAKLNCHDVIDCNDQLIESDFVPSIIALITRQLRIFHACEASFEYHIRVYHKAISPSELVIDGSIFPKLDKAWLIRTFGAKAVGEDGDLLLSIMKESAQFADESVSYDFVGWSKIDNKLCFLANGFRVDADAISAVNTIKRPKSQMGMISPEKACQFIQTEYLRLFQNRAVGGVFLCFSALANLQFPIRHYGGYVNFLLYIHGESGTGKSSTAFPMLNPFDLPSASVTDTQAATLQVVTDNHCSVTVLDDVKSVRAKGCISTLETLVRIAGDEFTASGRKIGRSVEHVQLDNLIAVTGEIEPPLQPSSIARMLVLEFDKGTVNVDKLKNLYRDLDRFKLYTICFLMQFIRYALSPGWMDSFISQVSELERQLLQKMQLRHGRYYRMLAWIECVWESLAAFGKRHGADFGNIEDFRKFIRGLVHRQDEQYSPKSPVVMYLATLNYLIESGKLKCVNMQQSHKTDDFDIIIHEGKYFIRSFTVYEAVKGYLSSKGIAFELSERKIRGLLREQQIIIKKGKLLTHEHKIGLNCKSASFMEIYISTIRDFLQKEGYEA